MGKLTTSALAMPEIIFRVDKHVFIKLKVDFICILETIRMDSESNKAILTIVPKPKYDCSICGSKYVGRSSVSVVQSKHERCDQWTACVVVSSIHIASTENAPERICKFPSNTVRRVSRKEPRQRVFVII